MAQAAVNKETTKTTTTVSVTGTQDEKLAQGERILNDLAAFEKKLDQPHIEGATVSATDIELLRRLEDAQKQIEALNAKNLELEQQAAEAAEGLVGRRLKSESGPYAPKGGSYEFIVGPRNPDDWPHLKPWRGPACDESEVLRWYCANRSIKPGSKTQIDPVTVKLKVVCVDKRRIQSIQMQQRLSALRKKANLGMQLSPADQELLNKFEAEIFNYVQGE